jgi:hypothetical protein
MMERCSLGSKAVVTVMGLVAAVSVAHAAPVPANELVARVARVAPGGRQFEVTDRQGTRIRVARPVRPLQATTLEVNDDLANTTALQEGDMVLLSGAGHGDWFEARRVQVLDPTRRGAATTAPVLRFEGFVGARELRAESADGVEYRVVFPPRPQVIPVWKAGSLIEPSALREGDRILAHGLVRDQRIRADRVEVLDESRLGRGAGGPFLLTYRASAGWRRLTGEAADGTRYTVALPRRPQALYFSRDGELVEPSALRVGDIIEVRGFVRGDQIEARQVILR